MSKTVVGKNFNHPVLLFDAMVVVSFCVVVVFLGTTVFSSNKSIRINKHRATMVGAIETRRANFCCSTPFNSLVF